MKKLPIEFEDISSRLKTEDWKKTPNFDTKYGSALVEISDAGHKYQLNTGAILKMMSLVEQIILTTGITIGVVSQHYNNRTFKLSETGKKQAQIEANIKDIKSTGASSYSKNVNSKSYISNSIILRAQERELARLELSPEYELFKNKKRRNERIIIYSVLAGLALSVSSRCTKQLRNDRQENAENYLRTQSENKYIRAKAAWRRP